MIEKYNEQNLGYTPKIKSNQNHDTFQIHAHIYVAQKKKTSFMYMIYVIEIPEHKKTWDDLVQAMENQFPWIVSR